MNFTLSSRLVIEEAMLTDMSAGNSRPIKEYMSYVSVPVKNGSNNAGFGRSQ